MTFSKPASGLPRGTVSGRTTLPPEGGGETPPTPSGGLPPPRGSRRGGWDPSPGEGVWSLLGEPPGTPPGPRSRGVPGGYRGAPPRGVDVKPRTRPGPDGPRGPRGAPSRPGRGRPLPGSGRSRDPGSGDPVPGPRGVPGDLREPFRGPPGSPGPLGGRGFTSTPRAGAPRFPGVREVPDATSRRVTPGLAGP